MSTIVLIIFDDSLVGELRYIGFFTFPFEALLIFSWGFGMPVGAVNPLSWTVSAMFFHYAVFGALCRTCVLPYFKDEQRSPCRIYVTAVASALVPYGLFLVPAWMTGSEEAAGHFYFGARSNPLVTNQKSP